MSTFDLTAVRARSLLRLKFLDLFEVKEVADETIAEAEQKALDDYFSHFARPPDGHRYECIGCGRKLTGIFGTFTWGLAHGEGLCGSCGYPVRMYHRFDEGPVQRLTMPLQYHPDDLLDAAEARAM